MPKKKIKGIFGKSVNIWDFVLISILLAIGYRFYLTEGLNGLFDKVLAVVFFGIIGGGIASFLIRRGRK